MKITTPAGVFGPYENVEVLDDRYRVDGPADLPFTVIGQGEVSEASPDDFPPTPEPVIDPVPEPVEPTKQDLLAQLQALQAQIAALP